MLPQTTFPHFFLRQKLITRTKEELGTYYGDSTPSFSIVTNLNTEFRCDRISMLNVLDDQLSARWRLKTVQKRNHITPSKECCSTATRTSFCANISPWTKHGCSTRYLRPSSNRNSQLNFFWNECSKIRQDCHQQGSTFNGQYYANLSNRYNED